MINVSFTEMLTLVEGYSFFHVFNLILVFLRLKQNMLFIQVILDSHTPVFCASPRYRWLLENSRPI